MRLVDETANPLQINEYVLASIGRDDASILDPKIKLGRILI